MNTHSIGVRGVAPVLAVALLAGHASAGVVFGLAGTGLGGGSRWDSAPRGVNIGGTVFERSLNGGLRYSLQGASYQAYRDLFSWDTLPSVPDFTLAVNQAFSAWTSTDAATGLNTTISFTPGLTTSVAGTVGGGGINPLGAEIDLFGSRTATFWGNGNPGPQGECFFSTTGSTVKLTSGTTNYAASAIFAADITMNSNPEATYSLDLFRRILTHEIGHAIGLGDVEGDINPGRFIDDNMDVSSSASAVATLNNSWALLVNPLNPAASPLTRFTAPFNDPGLLTEGVDILMESRGVGISFSNPLESLIPLTNDDYGTRQFLYPTIPAPAVGVACVPLLLALRRRRA
ncbi:MAG: hypothetical protein ACKVS8_11735 [Phycisphaerales bacterium]